MIFGFNTEIKIGTSVYHVQTEEYNSRHTIETTVYMGGRLVHRRKSSYEELLDSPNFSDAALRQRVEEQHKGIIDELRGGTLGSDGAKGTAAAKPAAAPAKAIPLGAAASSAPAAAPAAAPAPKEEPAQPQILNPASWYAAGTATLKIDVKSQATNQPLADAMLLVLIQSPQGPITFAAKSDNRGRVELVFPMPRMGPAGAEITIKAGDEEIKYSLKPTTS